MYKVQTSTNIHSSTSLISSPYTPTSSRCIPTASTHDTSTSTQPSCRLTCRLSLATAPPPPTGRPFTHVSGFGWRDIPQSLLELHLRHPPAEGICSGLHEASMLSGSGIGEPEQRALAASAVRELGLPIGRPRCVVRGHISASGCSARAPARIRLGSGGRHPPPTARPTGLDPHRRTPLAPLDGRDDPGSDVDACPRAGEIRRNAA
ncbi:hypothetical protein B2J93_1090 [Marssonina coronariae]|uniref:Uncharacterized protein n=1 Tax=Diplocarpon coronariae TaxID=2795749 RepID=A0A218Z081_9HELO|nr:hypothetical protein B2J93_1090 [Marssonina coronariae]